MNEADVRNVYTMACMMWAFCSVMWACMVFNWDATQYFCSEDDNSKAVYIKSKDDSDELPLTRESAGTLGLSIKYYHLHNAKGMACEPVYIIADDDMAADDFFHIPIIGLGNSTDVGSKGHLCFCKTRSCNEAFYRWFAKEVVIPFIASVREYHQPLVINLDDHFIYFNFVLLSIFRVI